MTDIRPRARSSVPPALTDEQRRAGWLKQQETRAARAAIREQLVQGAPLTEVWTQPHAQGMKVYSLLRSMPGIGERKAELILRLARIPVANTVKRCGPKQTEQLFAQLKR